MKRQSKFSGNAFWNEILLNDYPILKNNLMAWYRSDAAYQDVTLTTLATQNDDPVKAMKDLAGSFDAINVDSANVLQNSVISNRSVVRKTGGLDQLNLPSTLTISGAFTVYAVGEPFTTNPTNASDGFWEATSDNTHNSYCQLFSGPNNTFQATGLITSGNYDYAFKTWTNGNAMISRWRRDAANKTYWASTGNVESELISEGDSTRDFTVEQILSISGYPSNGDFAEILIYNTDTVTTGTDHGILSYLSNRYGLTIP